MKTKNILYIGNNLTEKTKYTSPITTLSSLLSKEGYRVVISSNKLNKILRLLDMCTVTLRKRKEIDFLLIDTFSTSNFYYALLVSQLARIFSIKYIPILHGGNLPYRIEKSSFLSNLLFKNSYYNVAPSQYLKIAFEAKGYATICIPNTIPIQEYQFKERTSLAPKLFWVRSFKHLYNPMLAIKVLDLVKKEFPKASLCMVGPEKDSSFLETKNLVAKLNLSEFVEFTGVLPKEQWHQKAVDFDFFINTTNFDNTPISVIEAMALGLPVVSTDVGGLPYLIENNIDGILVPKENPEAMAKAIVKLIKENNQLLAKKAREKAESFSWLIVKDKWHSILQ